MYNKKNCVCEIRKSYEYKYFCKYLIFSNVNTYVNNFQNVLLYWYFHPLSFDMDSHYINTLFSSRKMIELFQAFILLQITFYFVIIWGFIYGLFIIIMINLWVKIIGFFLLYYMVHSTLKKR